MLVNVRNHRVIYTMGWEWSLQDFKRSIAIQSWMRLNCIIKIDKSNQFLLPVFAINKLYFIVPHLHQCSNHSFRFAVGLWVGWFGKFLINSVLKTGNIKRLNHIFQQEISGTVRRFVRHNGYVKFSWKRGLFLTKSKIFIYEVNKRDCEAIKPKFGRSQNEAYFWRSQKSLFTK